MNIEGTDLIIKQAAMPHVHPVEGYDCVQIGGFVEKVRLASVEITRLSSGLIPKVLDLQVNNRELSRTIQW
jgi:hypothetical protein